MFFQVYTNWAERYDEDLKSFNGVGNGNMMKVAFEFIRNCESSLMLDIGAGKEDANFVT